MVSMMVGKVEVPMSAHCKHFEHYSPQPNPNKLYIILFGSTIMLWMQWYQDHMNQSVYTFYENV